MREAQPGPERLQVIATEFERDMAIPCTVAVSGTAQLNAEAGAALEGVARRALTDIRTHPHPQRVRIGLEHRPGGTRLTVQAHNYRPVVPDGSTLEELHEQARQLGGVLEAAPTADGVHIQLANRRNLARSRAGGMRSLVRW